jgi:FkbM family methyltransferase
MLRKIELRDASFRVHDNGELCWNQQDSTSFWDAFERDQYEPGTMKLLRKFAKPGATIVDIGAWVGAFSLYAAAKGADVWAYEPDPLSYRYLRENYYANAFMSDRANIRQAAITAEKTEIGSLIGVRGSGLTRFVESGQCLLTISAEEMLDSIGKIAFVKIDIEGYETELMPTLGPLLSERKIPVQVSLHGEPITGLTGYQSLIWTDSDRQGDVIGLPFITMNPGAWCA